MSTTVRARTLIAGEENDAPAAPVINRCAE
jgi:hypothetical protein